jgi:hypothetical protein
MNLRRNSNIAILAKRFVLLLASCLFASAPVFPCTVFVLTGAHRVLFCNNEDWSNPRTRIWFVPAGEGHYGCVYVGFDDGWAQGGMNTKGLAFDWVAGFMEKWEPGPGMKPVRGNPSERMIETCATVEEAIAFYRTHRETSFSRAKILIADRTGASVIIGAKDGQLQFERAHQSRGFGYGGQILETMLPNHSEPTVANGVMILRACLQKGQYATKYSNVFDLKSGDISLYQFPEHTNGVNINLTVELGKGGHYYDMSQISQQLTQAPIPLLNNMKRLIFDELKPIPDKEPDITRHLRAVIQDAVGGAMRPGDYTADFWKEVSSAQKDIQADLNKLGHLNVFTLVDRRVENGRRVYRYHVDFTNARTLLRFVLDENDKVALFQTEASEGKAAAGH